jgi:XTP/dITP diphosphohydrolase
VQLTFLLTSPRVAPGLMSWSAWQAISSAERVLTSDDSSPLFRAVSATGHRVDVLPSPTAADLLAAAGTGHVVWLASDEESERLASALAAEIVSAGETGRSVPTVEVLHGSYDVPGARLLDLVTVMDRLRTACPWDREQTHRTLA